jgi:omega-6 fatty acid desaturase (delta-12 desaturase)
MSQQPLTHVKKLVEPFEQIEMKKSVRQIVNTLAPLFILWYLAYVSLSVSYWVALPLTIVAAGFMVRTFILFHDCCHQSFFKNRRANEILGTLLGVLTVVPYQQWKSTHSIHHATSGNLDQRGTGDLWVMTVDEYKQASRWTRIRYRLYRNPLILFGFGPTYTFLIEYRFNKKGVRRKERINTYVTNVLIIGLYAFLCWLVGWQAFLLIQAPIFLISGTMGMWLFYVQHQFEPSYFEQGPEWSYYEAAIEGSSYFKLPRLLQWITGNIGFHHVHHLSPKVPNYNLEKVHHTIPLLQNVKTITILSSLKSVTFRLWDEENRTFIGFKSFQQRYNDV